LKRYYIYYYYYYFFDPGTQFPGNEKLRYAIQKKYKNQAGMNLTPPPPSQNSHTVGWHCTAESERRVAEILSGPLLLLLLLSQSRRQEN